MKYLDSFLVVIKVGSLDIHRKRPAINKLIKKGLKKMTKRDTVYLTHPVGQNLLFCRGGQLQIHKIGW